MLFARSVLGGASVALLVGVSMASAHPGGLNAQGCHNDRKHGGYHCHRSSSPPVQAFTSRALSGGGEGSGRGPRGGGAFANCSAARAAGAAPVRLGDPGYGRHLDRDGDGVGCER